MLKRDLRHVLYVSLTCFFALTLATSTGRAQLTTTASINGTVVDASGAVVPEAEIKATNKDTGAVSTTQSNGSGAFVLSGLPIGTYDLSVGKAGFNTYLEMGIELHPAVVTTINPTLKTGSVTQEITVNALATAVQTSTPEVSAEVAGAEAATLPLNGRNYQSLSALMPGVTNDSPDTALNQGGFLTNNVMSINGMGVDGSLYYLDGVTNMNTGSQTYTGITPNPDTIQEVRVLQNNFGSQYSLKGASVVLLQTKSGTDNFHGTLFEYLRNNDLDARNFFSPSVPALHQNIFGGTVGGPLFFPRHRPKNPKAFFFGSIQFAWDHVGNVELGTAPSAAEQGGNFGELCKAGFNASGVCTNSAQQITNPNAAGAPFAYNVIAPNLLNPQAQYLMGVLTQAPNNGTGFLNFLNAATVINKTRDDEGKIDVEINPKLHLMVEYLDERQINNNTYDTFLGSPYTTSADPIKSDNQLAQIQLTATLSPSMVNTFSVATEQAIPYLRLSGIWLLSQVPSFSENLPFKGGFRSDRIPEITFGEGYSPFGDSTSLPLSHSGSLDDTLSDDWSWLRGNHYIQAGYDLDFGTKRQDLFAASNGEWYFSGQFTGNPIADYLLGDSDTFYQQSTMLRPYVHDVISSPYIQDRWKVNKRLTLTLGLRMLYEPEPHATPGEDSAFNPALYSSTAVPIVNFDGTITPTPNYNPLNGIVQNGINGTPLNFSNKYNWFWAPTFGFAYDLFGDGKTALRGGYGLTYETIPAGADCSYTCAANIPKVPSITLDSAPFPNPTGAATAPPGAPSFGDNAAFNNRPVTVQNYSLSIEHQFPGNWFASLAGAGNIARHIWGGWNLNQPLPDAPYNFNPLINSDPALAGAAGIYPYVYAPYQGYGSINTLYSMATAYWDALEVLVKHPIGHNLFLNLAYTWQHDLGETSSGSTSTLDSGGAQDFYHPGNDYGNINLGAPQVFSATFVYSLPWFSTGHDYKNRLLGGWSSQGIFTAQSGFWLTPGLSVPFQGLATRPDKLAGAIKGPKTAAEWFNTAEFTAPAYGYFGNASVGSIPGPGMWDFDFALYKDFKVTERAKFQFRAEAFNLFNHTNFNAVSTNYGAGNFGAVTSALDPRIMEFALRFEF